MISSNLHQVPVFVFMVSSNLHGTSFEPSADEVHKKFRWNSWNQFHRNINEEIIRQIGKATFVLT
jgi:translation initiation factor RLI1